MSVQDRCVDRVVEHVKGEGIMKSEVASTIEVVLIFAVTFLLITGIVCLEAIALQWLLAQFGVIVGFWKSLGMLFVIDFILGSIKMTVRNK